MDRGFIWFIAMGNTSAYSVWLAMKEEVEREEGIKMMAYKNVNKRIIKLGNLGLIEELRPDKYSLHGRRDFRVTNEGMKQLILHILLHPNDVTKIIEYMDKYAMDKKTIANLLLRESHTIVETVSKFVKNTNLPELLGVFTPEGSEEYTEMQNAYEERGKIIDDFNKRIDEIENVISHMENSKLSKVKTKDKKKPN